MKSRAIREFHTAEPFRKFSLRLTDGKLIEVSHPEIMAMAPSGREVFVYHPDDSFTMIDIGLITAVEYVSPRKSKSNTR